MFQKFYNYVAETFVPKNMAEREAGLKKMVEDSVAEMFKSERLRADYAKIVNDFILFKLKETYEIDFQIEDWGHILSFRKDEYNHMEAEPFIRIYEDDSKVLELDVFVEIKEGDHERQYTESFPIKEAKDIWLGFEEKVFKKYFLPMLNKSETFVPRDNNREETAKERGIFVIPNIEKSFSFCAKNSCEKATPVHLNTNVFQVYKLYFSGYWYDFTLEVDMCFTLPMIKLYVHSSSSSEDKLPIPAKFASEEEAKELLKYICYEHVHLVYTKNNLKPLTEVADSKFEAAIESLNLEKHKLIATPIDLKNQYLSENISLRKEESELEIQKLYEFFNQNGVEIYKLEVLPADVYDIIILIYIDPKKLKMDENDNENILVNTPEYFHVSRRLAPGSPWEYNIVTSGINGKKFTKIPTLESALFWIKKRLRYYSRLAM